MGGNIPGENFLGGFSRGEFSKGNLMGGNFPGGIFPGGFLKKQECFKENANLTWPCTSHCCNIIRYLNSFVYD